MFRVFRAVSCAKTTVSCDENNVSCVFCTPFFCSSPKVFPSTIKVI